MIKVVIVDDVPELQVNFKNLIELDREIKVAGFAANGIEVLKACDELAPDVVLMDLDMPVCNGVIGTQLIKRAFPKIKILVLTGSNSDEGLLNALQSGADGYIMKEANSEVLISAIKKTFTGESTIGPEVLIP
ncbi:MAG: response regulator transcription factor [Firmicutes bacterium]|nr:response regulator transcription factor [Bacillota bacterium]